MGATTKRYVPSPAAETLLAVAILIGLYRASVYSYPLFHVVAELFSIVVAGAIFTVFWNSRRFLENGFFLFLGIAYLFVAVFDLLHALAFKGMNLLPEGGGDVTIQFWIVARSVQALSLLAAIAFVDRKVDPRYLFSAYLGMAVLVCVAVFSGLFPVCYVEGVGLSGFKITAEYVVCAVFLVAMGLLIRRRADSIRRCFGCWPPPSQSPSFPSSPLPPTSGLTIR